MVLGNARAYSGPSSRYFATDCIEALVRFDQSIESIVVFAGWSFK